ncbi:hypothetical protein ABPG72_019177 [Tetrahymena utriculariae]
MFNIKISQTIGLVLISATLLIIVGIFMDALKKEISYDDEMFTETGSRNFSVWLKGINIPKSLEHIAYVSQDRIDQWLVDITNASKAYPTFCNTGDDKLDKYEFAAFLTIIGSETEFTYGFPCTHEQGCPDCTHCSYNTNGLQCLTDDKLQYFGRGPVQLSWNYNYADFSQSYFQDDRLVKNPTLLDSNTELCWASAVWFWMERHDYGGWCMPQAGWDQHDTCDAKCPNGPSGCSLSQCSDAHWLPRKNGSCHDAMHSSGSIGQVINIINGGYDCCPTTTYFAGFGHTLRRTEWWATIVVSWGLGLPWSQVDPVPINECPRAVGHINCTPLKENPENCWTCCTEKN